jgi:hypothetical protein
MTGGNLISRASRGEFFWRLIFDPVMLDALRSTAQFGLTPAGTSVTSNPVHVCCKAFFLLFFEETKHDAYFTLKHLQIPIHRHSDFLHRNPLVYWLCGRSHPHEK